ncbi:MAG TPA: ribosome biogenesis GTPase Der [Burkholderiaceae bacterium]|nr:ribosome biogenesis GTPase Der [Burkholderiaceae bacterium]
MELMPIVTLVGRANVGKSTLFNRITRSRDALVANFPGLTRDRHYGEGRIGRRRFIVVDTGGIEPESSGGLLREMARQTEQAIAESDVVIFLVDARTGLNAQDHEIAQMLRRSGQNVLLAVNKAEGMRYSAATAEFYELGLGEPHPISASHGDGVVDLVDRALDSLQDVAEEEGSDQAQSDVEADEHTDQVRADATNHGDGKAGQTTRANDAQVEHRIKLAIAGRPNVGKSTLINTIIGEERVIAFDMPGTTRDAIEVEFERAGVPYTLIDTAGLRRRGKVFETIEKFSVIKTLQAIEASNAVVLLLDAESGISDQDAHIAGFILEAGRALVVAINKWDAVDNDQRDQVLRDFNRKLRFLSFARMHTISALTGQGVGGVLRSVRAAHRAAFAKLSTPRLTRVLHAAVEAQQPPRKGIFRPKLRYAHQGGQNPPRIIVHGSALDAIPDSYRRYLETQFRDAFKLEGTPLRVEFKSSRNPYVQRTQ